MPVQSSWLSYLTQRMLVKHSADKGDLTTDLRRCLSSWQLVLLGVGTTIGTGVYVIMPADIARVDAGPSMILAVLIASAITLVNSFVFAELATFIPHTGAQYIYLYKVFGEFAGFVAGCALIFIGMLLASTGSQGWSGLIDSYFNNTVQRHTQSVLGKNTLGQPFAETPDVLAFVLQIGVTFFVSFNIMCTSMVNTALGIMNFAVLFFVFVIGLVCGDSHTLENADGGGFFPSGVSGLSAATISALFAISDPEFAVMSAEEAKNPAKSLPRAMIVALLMVVVAYLAMTSGVLLLIPYWLIDLRSPLASVFAYRGLEWGKLIVNVGPMVGLSNLQIVVLYSISRCIYRMAKDDLLFSFFLKVNESSGIPLRAVVFAGLASSLLALLFDISYLVKITVILKMLSYIAVSVALIKLKITHAREDITTSHECVDEGQNGRQILGNNTSSCLDRSVKENNLGGDLEGVSTKNSNLTNEVHKALGSISPEINITGSPLKNKFSFLLQNEAVFDKLDKSSENNTTVPVTQCPDNRSNTPEDNNKNIALLAKSLTATNGHNYGTIKPHLESNAEQTMAEDSTNHVLNLNALNFPSSEHNSLATTNGQTEGQLPRGRDEPKHQVASQVASLIPGVITANVLLLLHLISCVGLAAYINSYYCYEYIRAERPEAIAAFVVLSCLVLFFSFFLWALCVGPAVRNEDTFKTPLMPLVPTLAMILCTIVLFTTTHLQDLLALSVVIMIAISGYVMITSLQYHRDLRRADISLGQVKNVDDEHCKDLVLDEH